ncbi:traK [Rugamonas sp. FT103W]|uniref:TraK n=2 Tax=Rugamonas rivuli TaxID=2743358 RepID=A0A843SN13_9BURK|nr:traK [Rugamonas rivuli]
MGKSYPDQLGAWVKRREAAMRDHNLVAFLAVRDDVRAALDAGYAAKTIWSNLREAKRIELSYGGFLRYVHKFLDEPAKAGNKQAKGAVSSPTVKPTKPAGFVFNSAPKKEELL